MFPGHSYTAGKCPHTGVVTFQEATWGHLTRPFKKVLPSDQQFQGIYPEGEIVNVHKGLHCGVACNTDITGNRFMANNRLLYGHHKAQTLSGKHTHAFNFNLCGS